MFRALLFMLAATAALRAQDCSQRTAEDFVPMTKSERLVNDFDSVVSSNTFFLVTTHAAIDQAVNRPLEWHQGAEGFGLRAGSIYAQTFIGAVLEQTPNYFLHYDGRYFASGQRGLGRRLGYAVTSALLTRRDDGSRGVAYTAIGGAAGAAFISRAWQPRSASSAGDSAISFGLTMGIRMGLNVVREFTPRMRGILR